MTNEDHRDFEEIFGELLRDATRTAEEKFEALPEEKQERFAEEFGETLRAAIADYVENVSQSLLEATPDLATERVGRQHEYESFVDEYWGKGLDLCLGLITAVIEAATDFVSRQKKADAQRDPQLDLVIDLHARAIRIANEGILLARNGYAEATYARWRALHEVTVVTMYLADADTETVTRYRDFEYVEAWKAKRDYKKLVDHSGYAELTESEIAKIDADYERVKARYGDRFTRDFGWTPPEMGNNVGLYKLEKVVGIDHLRGWFGFASNQIHAGPKGMIGHRFETPEGKRVLVGPHVRGLCDPTSLICISLMNATCALLGMREETSTVFILSILERFSTAARDALYESHLAVEASDLPLV